MKVWPGIALLSLLELAAARIEIVPARLAELEADTRPEQIAQTRGLLN